MYERGGLAFLRCCLTGLKTATVVMEYLNVVRVIVFRSIVGQVAVRNHQCQVGVVIVSDSRLEAAITIVCPVLICDFS